MSDMRVDATVRRDRERRWLARTLPEARKGYDHASKTADRHRGMPPDPTIRPATDRLLLDTMLGKLAVYLRMGGYDTAYAGDRGVEADDVLRKQAREEGRRLVSRDTALVAPLDDAVLLTTREITDQLEELRAAGFELELADPPAQCGRCNGRLESVPRHVDRPAYAPAVEEEPDCWRCLDCGQFFWKGSHWDRVGRRL